MPELQGKGMYLWKIAQAEGGSPEAIAETAKAAGLSHVLVKIADGDDYYNIDPSTGKDLAGPLIKALNSQGIAAWGWHYVYGYDPIKEADAAINRIRSLDLAGYVIDAEAEYKQAGKDVAARQFMNRLRAALPNYPIALSSYRYPSYHPNFPWKAFLEKVDLNMPQVYWLLSHNPGDQLRRCVGEFQGITPFRPIVPTGAAFKQGQWYPTQEDMLDFMQTARSMNLTAVNYWEWANCRSYIPDIWKTISDFSWAQAPEEEDIVKQYISALNGHDPARVTALYNPGAVHVIQYRTIQGTQAIANWFTKLFQSLPDARFVLSNFSGTGSARQFYWTATSKAGKVLNGNDTFGLANGKIQYHFSSFSVT